MEVEAIEETHIVLNITPNRPDLLDFMGLVRALDNYTGKRTPKENFYKLSGEAPITIKVDKAVKKIRPYIAGLVVNNANLSGNMLKYLINFTEKYADTYGRKRKKIAIGVHNLAKIKGMLTYTASPDERFVPLNSSKEMSFAEIMKEHAKGVEYQDTVPVYGKSARYPMLKDDEKIIAMIPITNSEATKITESTKNLFIDITGTSRKAVRETADLLACSFIYAGAEAYPVKIQYDSKDEQAPILEYNEIKVRMSNADKTLGVEAGRHDVIALANKMGYTAAKLGGSVLFYVPPYRVDVLNEQDIIEDIAIAYGYDNIEPIPIVSHSTGLSNEINDFENKVAVHMLGMGYLEAVNLILTNERVNYANMLAKEDKDSTIKLADSKSTEITMVRTGLLPGLLKNLSESMNERMPQRLFEIGRVFSLEDGKIRERLELAIVSEHPKANFAEILSVVNNLMRFLERDYKLEKAKASYLIDGRCADVKINNGSESIGYIGEVHPQVLSNFGLDTPIVAATITLINEIKYSA
ncbi:MAG: phenylalanine--tRNA ligase subunit beta, partial [Candidatus Marsarchaeota archaeon]|nr:phenylalanine--tRNA ligase subunit beta [Candidatus Marsarchaeota archaeon]